MKKHLFFGKHKRFVTGAGKVIRKRFAVYSTETSAVAEHYKAAHKFKSIKGEGSVDAIFDSLCAAIDKKMN